MAEELCAVLLLAVYLTLDSTTDISVFLSMWFFYLFYMQSNCKLSL